MAVGDGGVTQGNGEQKNTSENRDGVCVAAIVSSSLQCMEQCCIGDGLECFADGGQRG